MKKFLLILMTGVILVTAFNTFADAGAKTAAPKLDKKSQCYYILDKKGNAVVTGCGIHYSSDYPSYWKIPSKLNGHTVTEIRLPEYDEYSDGLADKVKIPKTVKKINENFADAMYWTVSRHCGPRLVVNKNSYAHKYAIKYQILYYLIEDKHYYSYILNDVNIYDSKGKKVKGDYLPDCERCAKENKPKFTLKQKGTGKILKPGVDYTYKYRNNVAVGEGIIIIKGKKNYFREEDYLYFKIVPERLDTFTIKNGWQSGESFLQVTKAAYMDTPTSYELRYSSNKDFANYKTVKAEKLSDLKIEGLEPEQTYYAQLRASVYYKPVHGVFYRNEYTITGKWSKILCFIPNRLEWI